MKLSVWHTPLEEPECDDYDYVLYDFGHGHVEVLFAKSYVDMTQVKDGVIIDISIMASYTITKYMARNAACCLVRKNFEKKEEELTKKEHKLGEFLARKYYPDPVLQVISLYSEYVGYYSSFYVKCEKLTSRRIDTLLRLPMYKNVVYVNIEEYKAVCKIRDEWNNLKAKKSSTQEHLINEILKLRTYNRVKEQVPELLPFLPKEKEEKKPPAANYGSLKEFVKSIVETK